MRDTFVTFDIETEGFGVTDDFVCGAIYNGDMSYVTQDLKDLLDELNKQAQSNIIVTFNGENYHGGFDIPFLRSYCLKNGIDWVIKGIEHLDLMPIIKKRFNTSMYTTKLPSRSSLRAPELKELAEANDIDYQNKKQCHKALLNLEENADWLGHETIKTKERNGLQDVYKMFFDPNEEESYISGGKVPELYKRYKKLNKKELITTKEAKEIKKIWNEIFRHNELDVVRLYKLVSLVHSTIPEYYIEREKIVL